MSPPLDEFEQRSVESLLWAVAAGIARGKSEDVDEDDATTVASGSRMKNDEEGVDLSSLASILLQQKIDVDCGDLWEIDDHVNEDEYYRSGDGDGGEYGSETTPSLEVSIYSLSRASSAPELADDEPAVVETRNVLRLDDAVDYSDDDYLSSNFDLTVCQDDSSDSDTLSTLTRETKPVLRYPVIMLRHGSLRSRETPSTLTDKQDSVLSPSRLGHRFDKRSRLRSTDPADPNDIPRPNYRVLVRQATE